MLVLPRMTTSAAFSFLVSVASYGGIQPSRIFEPTVVGMPSVVKMSEGALAVDVQEGVHLLVDGLDAGEVGLGDLDGRELAGSDLRGGLGGGELDDVRHDFLVLPQDLRHLETLLLLGRGAGERLLGGERGTDLVRPHDVGQRERVRGRRYVLVGDLTDACDRADDVVQLACEVLELFGLQLQTRQPGEVGDLLARDARHAAILWGECVWFGPILWGGALCP
jgi:hypothetical protein